MTRLHPATRQRLTGSAPRRWLCACAGIGSAALVLDCGSNADTTTIELAKRPRPVGTLTVPLERPAPSGIVYRLVGATLDLDGPSETQVSLDSDETSVTVELLVGNYQAELLDGWELGSVEDGTFQPVAAALTSPNPLPFEIAANQETRLSLQFALLAPEEPEPPPEETEPPPEEEETGTVTTDIEVDESAVDAGMPPPPPSCSEPATSPSCIQPLLQGSLFADGASECLPGGPIEESPVSADLCVQSTCEDGTTVGCAIPAPSVNVTSTTRVGEGIEVTFDSSLNAVPINVSAAVPVPIFGTIEAQCTTTVTANSPGSVAILSVNAEGEEPSTLAVRSVTVGTIAANVGPLQGDPGCSSVPVNDASAPVAEALAPVFQQLLLEELQAVVVQLECTSCEFASCPVQCAAAQ